MYFCENLKCMFHITVARSVFIHIMTNPEQIEVRPLDEDIPKQRQVSYITRGKHLWRDPKGIKPDWFFCDACHEAAEMVLKI